MFQNADAHSEATGAALLLSEFGDTENAEIHRRLADLADRFMVSWTSWAYAGSTGQMLIDPAKPPAGDNIRTETLRALVRAYPYVVAGTPRRIDWNLEDKRLETAWSTTLPGGGPAGQAVSELFVPDLHFNGRYKVEMRGGEAIGGLGSQELLVRACPAAGEVGVTIADGLGSLPVTCSEQGSQANPPAPGGRRVRCPRGNSRTVRCARTTLADGTRVLQVVGTRRHERLAGSRGRDVMVCGAGNDRLRGRAGPDTVRCGPGRDRIRAGDGADRVFPGAGRDRVSCGRGRDRTRAARRRDRALVRSSPAPRLERLV